MLDSTDGVYHRSQRIAEISYSVGFALCPVRGTLRRAAARREGEPQERGDSKADGAGHGGETMLQWLGEHGFPIVRFLQDSCLASRLSLASRNHRKVSHAGQKYLFAPGTRIVVADS